MWERHNHGRQDTQQTLCTSQQKPPGPEMTSHTGTVRTKAGGVAKSLKTRKCWNGLSLLILEAHTQDLFPVLWLTNTEWMNAVEGYCLLLLSFWAIWLPCPTITNTCEGDKEYLGKFAGLILFILFLLNSSSKNPILRFWKDNFLLSVRVQCRM